MKTYDEDRKTFDRACDLLDHKRAEISWIVRAGMTDTADGRRLRVIRMARIVVVRPQDGAGRLRVAVTDWGKDGCGPSRHGYAAASGHGYDKLTAALAGCTVGGVELGDHSDHVGRPTLRDVIYTRPTWEALGSINF